MHFLIINGPNLNLLGQRDPRQYGNGTYKELCKLISDCAKSHADSVDFFQSNHEGAIIDVIQQARGQYDGIVINPGAYAHYSYAIHDALLDSPITAVEVHISDIESRDDWRRVSVTAPACAAMIAGHGFAGYCEAMELLRERKC